MRMFSHNEMFRIILEKLVSTDIFSPLISNSSNGFRNSAALCFIRLYRYRNLRIRRNKCPESKQVSVAISLPCGNYARMFTYKMYQDKIIIISSFSLTTIQHTYFTFKGYRRRKSRCAFTGESSPQCVLSILKITESIRCSSALFC